MSWEPRKRISSVAFSVMRPAEDWIRRARTASRTALRTRRWISRACSRLCLELMPDRSTARIPGQLEAEPLQLLARRSVVRLDVRLAGGRLIEVLAAPEAGRRDQLQD